VKIRYPVTALVEFPTIRVRMVHAGIYILAHIVTQNLGSVGVVPSVEYSGTV